MGIKSKLILPYAHYVAKKVGRFSKNAVNDQQAIMQELISKGRNTLFGKDHNLADVSDYESFKKNIPIRDYEELRPYVDRIVKAEKDVLWPGLPKYLAKTSGTTSGIKYIPITKDSMPNHMNGASQAVLNYISQKRDASVFDGKVMFLSGSPELDHKGGIPTGRLSGIVNHEVPSWAKANQVPSYSTNCIEDWEVKLEKVVEETLREDMRLVGGIPPWVQMYYERLLEKTGKETISDIFKNLSLFVYGGVNYEPYRSKLAQLVGNTIDSVELYPASEGFIAFQDSIGDPGLLLNTNSGIFYEFIPSEEVFHENPTRLKLDQVELGKNYALIINNNAGLWGYNIGDSIQFTSLDPYKIVVTGRIKHFISAFGEHVIGKEVEEALMTVAKKYNSKIIEFTVAPQVQPPEGGTPYHEWFIEFDEVPQSLQAFTLDVDREMNRQNIYYEDLISGGILQPLKIRCLERDAFRNYMKSKGKLGGQNKVPRLSNDRKIVEGLKEFILLEIS